MRTRVEKCAVRDPECEFLQQQRQRLGRNSLQEATVTARRLFCGLWVVFGVSLCGGLFVRFTHTQFTIPWGIHCVEDGNFVVALQ
jgi:hypothetical protein